MHDFRDILSKIVKFCLAELLLLFFAVFLRLLLLPGNVFTYSSDIISHVLPLFWYQKYTQIVVFWDTVDPLQTNVLCYEFSPQELKFCIGIRSIFGKSRHVREPFKTCLGQWRAKQSQQKWVQIFIQSVETVWKESTHKNSNHLKYGLWFHCVLILLKLSKQEAQK